RGTTQPSSMRGMVAESEAIRPPSDENPVAHLTSDPAGAALVAYRQGRGWGVSLPDMKRRIERDCIARALAETKGNISRAAALLGMKRPLLSQLVKQYGLSAV